MSNLDWINNYICSNHLIRAVNCGHSYLPFDINEIVKSKGTEVITTLNVKAALEDSKNLSAERVNGIFEKVFANMNFNTTGMKYQDILIDKDNSIQQKRFEPILNILLEEQSQN